MPKSEVIESACRQRERLGYDSIDQTTHGRCPLRSIAKSEFKLSVESENRRLGLVIV